MLAIKCDRCGKLYEKSDIEIDGINMDSFMLSKHNDFYRTPSPKLRCYDLCQNCLEEFKDWMKAKSKQEGENE